MPWFDMRWRDDVLTGSSAMNAEIKHLNDQIHSLILENERIRQRLAKWEDVSDIPVYEQITSKTLAEKVKEASRQPVSERLRAEVCGLKAELDVVRRQREDLRAELLSLRSTKEDI